LLASRSSYVAGNWPGLKNQEAAQLDTDSIQ
jgi:hypothetical protein